MKLVILSLLLFLLPDPHTPKVPPYLDPNLLTDQRVEDLLKRMTLEEKIGQMCQFVSPEHMKATELAMRQRQPLNKDAWSVYPGLKPDDIETMVQKGMIGSFLHVLTLKEANSLQALAQKSRLKIPLLMGIDAIHGDGMVAGTTVYPSPIGLAATWDTTLVKITARFTAEEMRATGSQWAFSPNLDIARDARWGRVGETFGEDPFLVTQMGKVMITGLQRELNTNQDVLACAKHLVAGSQPVNGLNVAPADISDRTLNEIFLPPYQEAVKAGVYTVMPAHNEINGVPSHANVALMTELLRDKWGFKGFYISDFLDIERLAQVHGTAANQNEAVEQTLAAGMDMHMHGPGFMEPIQKLISERKISEARIDASVRRILKAKFDLGLFEQPLINESIPVIKPSHQATAIETARKSIVLLKNKQLLPFNKNVKTILVVGPNADNQAQLGDWSMQQPSSQITTILQGVKHEAPEGCRVDYADVGGSTLRIDEQKMNEAVSKASTADVIVVVVGENALRFAGRDRSSGENIDRDNTDLPGPQQVLLQKLFQTGKPVVAVLINGRPLSIPWLDAHLPAIIEAWEPGEAGGQAIAEILFGKTNPSGKLPVSIPRNVGQIPVYYNHKPSQYVRQYLGAPNTPLYEFGYGLSYTKFNVTDIKLNYKEITPGQTVRINVNVNNVGDSAGDEVLQLYIHYPANGITRAVKELKGFKRQHLSAGERAIIHFDVTPELLTSLNAQMEPVVAKGDYTLMVGTSSRDQDLQSVSLSVK